MEEEYINMPPLEKINLNTQPLEKINIKNLEKTIKKMIFMIMN